MTSTSRTGGRREVVASMREAEGAGVVRTESRFDTSAEDLWDALTTPERLARWIGEVSGDLRVGGSFTATFTSHWEGTGVVEVCEPHRRLRTRMDGEEGETVMEAVLEEQGEGVLLVIEERGLPLTNLSAYGAGWQVHVEDLGHHLDGTERTDWLERWKELVPGFRDGSAG